MIYTVTLNPSIDYIVEVDDFQINGLNRMRRDAKFPGGKGINVARVLNRIGSPVKALGFIGGFTGKFISDFLSDEKVGMDFVQITGDTRINIKLKTGQETEINGLGPEIEKSDYESLLKKLDSLQQGDLLVLSGSVPPSLPGNFYQSMTEKFASKGVKVVVDTSGNDLNDVIGHSPFLIKPNHHELGELFSAEINNAKDAVYYGRQLVGKGAQHVIVSMAGAGAVLCTAEECYLSNVPEGKVVNSVGAGDSMVAGFVGMYMQTGDLLEAFKYGVASGSATAFSADLCQKEDIETLLPQIKIQRM
ncbi:1-phosphofructokinase [Bacillus sp. M6-12]|uniref:1-phosphofructokinase n=1 Tax=Bacillus sp. M6-12 TaxID=2054166 RepID=UPI000C78518B|nr:1-phosphofructokinase [Bacillus sp. M6-12]PLS17104.1 1-phosphofructokinase [Bacillus sp. M6-12]